MPLEAWKAGTFKSDENAFISKSGSLLLKMVRTKQRAKGALLRHKRQGRRETAVGTREGCLEAEELVFLIVFALGLVTLHFVHFLYQLITSKLGYTWGSL